MCNRYALEGSYEDLAQGYHATPASNFALPSDVRPRALAPGLLSNLDGQRELHPMQYGFAPANSETPIHPKFTNHTAPIEEPVKWPWVAAIETSRCILPVTEFTEPSYWGDPEGTEICFRRADNQLLHAVGIYRLWTSAAGDQQLYTMSILSRPAGDYVMDHGHHRQPIFIERDAIDAWIDPKPTTSDAAIQLLRDQRAEPDLTHRHVRDLATGWEKRRNGKARDRAKQLSAIENCPHACGF